MVRWRRVSVALGCVVILLSGTMLASTFLPDTDRYANVVDLSQERLIETVRRIEFYKLQTGSYPETLSALISQNKIPNGAPNMALASIPRANEPAIETRSPVIMREVLPTTDQPILSSSAEPSSAGGTEPILPPSKPDCVTEKIVYRDYAVSDLGPSPRWIEPIPILPDKDCRVKKIIYVDRPVRLALPGSDVITDPTASRREAFFYELIGEDRYYLRAVGPDGVAFTGDDIFPQIDRTDATRIGLLEARLSVAVVEEGR